MRQGVFASWARRYFEKNISIIPCSGKAPVVKGWQQFCGRIAREDELGQWETQYSGFNIGAPMGRASGLVAVDIDSEDWFSCPLIPDSNIKRRGKKGEARFFRIPDGLQEEDLRAFALPGLDFIGHGKQIILPPSIHPDTQKPYLWLIDSLLNEEAPEIPLDLLTGFREKLSAWKNKGRLTVVSVPEGCPPLQDDTEPKCEKKDFAADSPEHIGRNNRLKAVAQAILKRGDGIDVAVQEVYLTDLREHAPEDWIERNGLMTDYLLAAAGYCNQTERQFWIYERGLTPLFFDPKEPYARHGKGRPAARAFVSSIAKTESARSPEFTPEAPEETFSIAPVLLEIAPKVVRQDAASKILPQIQRPDGYLGALFDECERVRAIREGEKSTHTVSIALAVTTMCALTQNRFLPELGTSSTSSLVLVLAPTGVGKSGAIDVSREILHAANVKVEESWKSPSSMQECFGEDRNQVSFNDEASSLLANMAQSRPMSVELQDNITRMLTHAATKQLPFLFPRSMAAKRDGRQAQVNSPSMTLLLCTTPTGFRETVSDTIGERGFIPRALSFYQSREDITEKENERLLEQLGPSDLPYLQKWAAQFVRDNPYLYLNGNLVTNSSNYVGALSIEQGKATGTHLSVPLEANGARHFFIAPRIVAFDDEAKWLFKNARRKVMDSIIGQGDEGGGLESRFGEWTARLAMLHAIGCQRDTLLITAIDMQWAIETATIMLRDIKTQMASVSMSRSMFVEEKVKQQIAKGYNTLGKIKNNLRCSKIQTDEIDKALFALGKDKSIRVDTSAPGKSLRYFLA